MITSPDASQLNAIFGALDTGIVLLDEERSIIAWNSWMERASGFAADKAIRRKIGDVFPQSQYARFQDAINAALESGVSSVLTHSLHKAVFPLRTAAGRNLIHDVSVRPLGQKGSRTCLLHIDDVTVAVQRGMLLRQRHEARYKELRTIEEQLRQSQKMEAVGQLTGSIAHDFNNLLQGIIGSLDRVQFRIGQGRINDVDRLLKGAMESANRAAALTHRLLAFSRRQPVAPKAVNPNDLIGSVEELLRRSIGENIALAMNLAPASWVVRCDPNQLENALLNLAINARDAMPDGGVLRIETANIVLDEQGGLARDVAAGEYISIKVCDSGFGMSDDVKARAFDPFFTTKPIGQGTGLGLSMIYGFVHQSDGGIIIESTPGLGTDIELVLPRHAGEVPPEEAQTDGQERHTDQGVIVLVVEDEAIVRHLVVETLEDLGYRALEAADGDAALRILRSAQRIDLLITDIGLPGMNGRQLADAARTRRPNLKTLFMTGYAETAASSNFLRPGMELITKPFVMDLLAKRIQTMLASI